MAVDPNVYALSIQLQLDSSDAFSTLEEFSQAAADVEERVSTAAQNSLNTITGLVDNLNQQLSQAVITTGQLADAANNVETKLVSSAGTLKDAYNTEQDSLEDLQERLEHLEKIDDLQSELEKSLQREQKTGEEYLGTINRWIDALESKNLIHDEEAGMIEAEQDLVDGMNDSWESIKETQIDSKDVLLKIRAAVASIWAIIKNFDKETENFVTANYRVYGSQQKLVNNTRQLSAEYGIFREEAIATYKALADVKTPREEIYKLSATVGRANRVTGVGIDVLAEYSFRLRGAGFDADRTRKQIDMLSAAQRKFGLSTYDVQKAIEAQTLSVGQQVMHFGKDAPEAFMKASLGLKAIDKELGTNAAEDWMKRLQLTGVEAEVFWDKFGIDAGASVEEKFDSMTKMAQIAADEVGISLDKLASGDVTQAQRDELKIIAEVYGVTEEMIYANARANAELTDEQKRNMMTMEGITEAFKDQIEADKRWRESMATLTAQLNQLKSAINAVIGWIVQLVADALIPVLYVLNFVVKIIGVFIGMIRSAIGWMEEWIPGFSLLMKIVKFVAGAIIGLILVLLVAGTALAAFGFAFGSVSNIVMGGLDIIRGVGRAILSIARAIGASIRVIFTGLGQGLAALGNAVKPVIIPLLQLAVAVVLVGAGFWLMGMGLKMASDNGWAALGMLVAMTVAMLAIIIVFAIIATVAGPVIPLIIALALAVLILGAAALLAGLGMYFMGMAVEQIANYGLQAAMAMPPLAAGVLLLGAAGLFASFGIMLLAAALWLLAPPVMMLGIGFYLMATAMQMISADQIIPTATAILQASYIFLAAGALLIPAGALLMIGAVLIMTASFMLSGAGVILIPAAWLLSIAAGILGPASETLLESAKRLYESGTTLYPASMMLWGAALALMGAMPLMISAGVLMTAAGAALMAGTLAFKLGTIFLGGVADTVYQNGLKIGRGGTQLLAGVRAILTAANLMGSAGSALKSSVKQLSSALESIDEDKLKLLGKLAWMLKWSGALIQSGAQALLEGAGILVQAAQALLSGSTTIQSAAQQLHPSSVLLVQSGYNIRLAGILLLVGALTILESVSSLWAAAFSLTMLVPTLANVGEKLVESATQMFQAGLYYKYAGKLMNQAADLLTLGALMLIDSSDRIMIAGVMLQYSSEQLYYGSFSLTIAASRLEWASYILWQAGRWLRPASRSIYIGMLWLQSATKRFRSSVDDIDKMGRGMHLFAESFEMLSHAPIDSIGNAADAALAAMPNVNKLARELDKSAGLFQAAADKFVKPVREISASLEELGGALAEIGSQGLTVQSDMDKLGVMLDKYAGLMGMTAERLELAVVAKAQPAMAAAREEGLEDAVRSEAITTVQVIDKTEGEAERVDENTLLLTEMATNLRGINDKMEAMGEGGGTELTTIVELLETYLPDMTSKDQGLTTEFNQWMK